MITVTPAAAEQIRKAAQEGQMEGMPLRIAAQPGPDGRYQYAMGFDDKEHPGDEKVSAGGVEVVIAEPSAPILKGATLDFAEIEPGKAEFIFINPNDPEHQLPAGD